MRVAIIGCGLIGNKRAAAIKKNGKLIITADKYLDRAEKLARIHGSLFTDDVIRAATHPDVDIVIVATYHDSLASIALIAVEAGKHVLIEKPGSRRWQELEPLRQEAEKRGVNVHVGFNFRFHPAMKKAKEIIDSGSLGPLYFIRGCYGHGGRLGYEREWRANPHFSGGGNMLDQASHLIDLSQWYFQESFSDIQGWISTYYWDIPVEDNAFCTLKTKTGKISQIQVSWTEWKNMFSFEIYGQYAKLHINGMGGSYGIERLAFYQMKPEMGPPDTTIFEYPSLDKSWDEEFGQFIREIQESRPSQPSIHSTQQVLSVIETIYKKNNIDYNLIN